MEAAQANLESSEGFLRRWICNKYNMPPTDPRYLAYTYEQAYTEFLEDAIEDERIPLGPTGKPVTKVRTNGTEIYRTGDPMFDAFEQEWADQDLDALDEEIERQEEAKEQDDLESIESDADILAQINKAAEKWPVSEEQDG